MEPSAVFKSIELIALGMEIVGVAVIGLAFLYATLRGLLELYRRSLHAYDNLKFFIGRALQLGLEFLVAADIIRTVTVSPTREEILSLGLLIVVRTVLSWSITVEIEGCWPWEVAKLKKNEAADSVAPIS
jgi:uncharacterized membrane protein